MAMSVAARKSVDAVLAQQGPTGAFVASPDFSQYGYCWLRDSSFVAYALDRVGETGAASAHHAWVEQTLSGLAGVMERAVEQHRAGIVPHPSELPPARFTLTGVVVADDWPNYQIDGYGTWLWALLEHLATPGVAPPSAALLKVVETTATYLSEYALSPCFDVWEMNGTAVHTSTLACVYGGLVAAAEILGADVLGDRATGVRDFVLFELGGEDGFRKSTVSSETEASNLWLAQPFGLVSSESAQFSRMVERIERDLMFEGGVRRFSSDTYFGGGAWPVLTASLGWHYAAEGNVAAAKVLLEWIEQHLDDRGRLGEQYGGENRNPRMFDEWVARWGAPARTLTWSHAMHLILVAELTSVTVEARQGGERPPQAPFSGSA